MPSGRRIVSSPECDASVLRLGGWRILDQALEPILDALQRNPYGFTKFECEWASVRYIVTDAIRGAPRLTWYFSIEGQEIILLDVEEFEDY